MLWDGEDVAALAPLAESRQAATRRKVTVRIYTHRVDSRQQHSYIMGSETGGLGARLSETVEFTAETTTLEELRVNLEVFMDRGMVRRSGIFQERQRAIHCRRIDDTEVMQQAERFVSVS